MVKYSIFANVVVGDNSSSKFCLAYAFVATHKIEPRFVNRGGEQKQDMIPESEKKTIGVSLRQNLDLRCTRNNFGRYQNARHMQCFYKAH